MPHSELVDVCVVLKGRIIKVVYAMDWEKTRRELRRRVKCGEFIRGHAGCHFVNYYEDG